MEPLVVEEVEQQLRHLPAKIANYIHPPQVVAYALNRLPALYATSEEGWHWQQKRAKSKLKEQIATAVRQGLVAVQRDPLKLLTPLQLEEKIQAQKKQEIPEPKQPDKSYKLAIQGWDIS